MGWGDYLIMKFILQYFNLLSDNGINSNTSSLFSAGELGGAGKFRSGIFPVGLAVLKLQRGVYFLGGTVSPWGAWYFLVQKL